MAGDWIKMRTCLPDDPAVAAISAKLGLDPDSVVGKLLRLWSWADQHTTDGNAPGVTLAFLDRCAHCDGFASALVSVGWLNETGSGVQFSEFDRHNSKSAKARGLTAKRVAAHKKNSNGGVTPPPLEDALPREEKNKKEKGAASLGSERPDTSMPGVLGSSADFRAAWLRWVDYRKEIRKPLKSYAIQAQLTEFAAWGPARAIAAINFTILKSWQGIREPDGPAPGVARTGPRPDYGDGGSNTKPKLSFQG